MAQLEELYNMYFKDVYHFIYSIANDKNIAEDITAETFLKALKSIQSFKGKSDIKTWLFQIAKNSYYSYLRKNKIVVSYDSMPEEKSGIDIGEKLISDEEAMEVQEIIHNLPEPYKEVVSLRIFGELTFKQIGSLFGKNDNWACVTFYRAKEKIKKIMEAKDESNM